MHSIIIEKAVPSDAEEILKLQRLAYQSEAEIYNNFKIQPLMQTLEEATAEFAESIVLKAVADGKIVGSVRVEQKGNTAYIGKFMVLPEYQNQGIGKRLLQAIESEVSVSRFELFTGFKSEKNIAVYEKSGYGIFRTESVADGLPFVYMQKYVINIREIIPADYPFLEEFLYNAIFIPEGEKLPPREIIFDPEIYVYIKDFDITNIGDCGVAAEKDGRIIGVAWTGIIPAYGHIDKDTPELAISVLSEYRGQNIGTKMMNRLFEVLRERGFKRTSLSVQKDNPAVKFYKRLGYVITDEKLDHVGNEDFIMIKEL
jgi:ribosomal protein S18 acetylase RimI-like enzyme